MNPHGLSHGASSLQCLTHIIMLITSFVIIFDHKLQANPLAVSDFGSRCTCERTATHTQLKEM